MTISSTVSRVDLPGNSSATTFSFSPIIITQASDLTVTLRDSSGNQTALTQGAGTTNYIVNVASYPGIGTITYPASGGGTLPTGSTISIKRVLPITQAVHLPNQGAYLPGVIEGEFDNLVMIEQQLTEQINRTIQLPATDLAAPITLPTSIARANMLLGFDSSGNPIAASVAPNAVVSSPMIPVVSAASIPVAAGLLGIPITYASVSAFRASTPSVPPTSVIIAGYYVPGDGGGGVLSYIAADTTSSDNGGTIFIDGSSRRYYRLGASGQVTDKQFGCKVDGTTDDTTALQAAVTAVAGSSAVLLLVPGVRVVSATISATAPVNIRGVGPGSGPGIMASLGCSIVLCKNTFTTGDVFAITTVYSCSFRDFQIAGALGLAFTSACPRASGAGIHLAGDIGHINSNSVIDNMGFSGMFRGIYLERGAENTITNGCYHQAWGSVAFYADNGNTATEASCGHVTRNQFFGNLVTAQRACMEIHCGYGDITANKFLGANWGLLIVADQTVNIGSVIVALNSFEENVTQSLFATTTSPTIASLIITGNQFSAISTVATITGHIVVQPSPGGAASELYNVDITGNNFNTQMTMATAAFIALQMVNGTVRGNKGRVLGGSAYGIVAETGTDHTLEILDNQWSAGGGSLLGTHGYLIQGNPIVRDIATRAITVALLSSIGTATDGSEVYVTDGHATNFGAANLTVTGSGPGCIAWRMSGAWLTFQT